MALQQRNSTDNVVPMVRDKGRYTTTYEPDVEQEKSFSTRKEVNLFYAAVIGLPVLIAVAAFFAFYLSNSQLREIKGELEQLQAEKAALASANEALTQQGQETQTAINNFCQKFGGN